MSKLEGSTARDAETEAAKESRQSTHEALLRDSQFAEGGAPSKKDADHPSSAADSRAGSQTTSEGAEKQENANESKKLEQMFHQLRVDELKSALLEAEAAHKAHDEKLGKETDWPKFYAQFLGGADKQNLRDVFDQPGELEKVLKDTEDAHGEFEEQTGEVDKDWAAWYAAQIIEKIDKRIKRS